MGPEVRHVFELDGTPHEVGLVPDGAAWHIDVAGGSAAVSLECLADGSCVLVLDGARIAVFAVVEGDTVHVSLDGQAYALTYRDPVEFHAAAAATVDGPEATRAPMPGVVLAVRVGPGDAVRAGDTLAVIESMKMETAIKAVRAGTVAAVHVAAGQTFERGAVLVTLAAAAGAAGA